MPKDYVEKEEKNVNSDGVLVVRGGNLRRILAELADVFTAFILAVTLYGVCFQKVFGFDKYSNEMANISSEMSAIMVDRSLYKKKDNGTVMLKADLEKPWFYHYLSKQSSSYTGLYECDAVQDYYMQGRIETSSKMSQRQYNVEILKLPENVDGSYENTIFAYDSSLSDPSNSEPIFSASTQENLIKYFAGNTDAYEPKKAFEEASNFFSETYDAAFSEAVKDEKYKGLVLDFASIMWRRTYLQSAAILVSYILAAIITFLLIPLIQFSDLTLGKRVAKLQVNDADGNKPRWYSFLIRGLVQIIAYCFMIPLVGVMSFGLGAFEMPFLEIGTFTLNLSVFAIVGLLLSLASLILMFVTPKKQSLHDLASLTYVNTSDIKKIRDAEMENKKKEDGREENG